MLTPLHHEQLHRGRALIERLASTRIILCGAGAVGSHLADALARQGARSLRIIDDDRIEIPNISTQLYAQGEVGLFKVEALRNILFRAAGVEIEPLRKRLSVENAARLLKDADLVVDAFDNSASRAAVQQRCRAGRLRCLHVGLVADYAEVIWDEHYRVPADASVDVCDYPLAHNLVTLATGVASETILQWIGTGRCHDWTITLADFAICGITTDP